ncbi:P-loop containing nucleoside triphosphate hydrolase protein [Schizophyllum amplum]|uniref:P-loop containing nucleoside triphosphate hydrolase protein n=1 Tax=Schizophyllum amplum TaxID=97359 RepID=A0A550BYK4_9AGAR|nr:P-loop containing nucleoside triphosphate hydrolase protein [Auriculariopsis ampla]
MLQGESSKKRPRKGKEPARAPMSGTAPQWPEYFDFALNTVLAFVSSRKHLATTFPVVRSSVEGLLKQPLRLEAVAELKALLPDLINFAYIPKNDILINDGPGQRQKSPDFSQHARTLSAERDSDGHVLILEFADKSKGKKSAAQGQLFTMPPAMTPAAVKRLVEKRNERFAQAVDDLIKATNPPDDPVLLLQAAGRDHIPIHPGIKPEQAPVIDLRIPDADSRPSIDELLSEIEKEEWYKEQMVANKVFEPRPSRTATLARSLPQPIAHALSTSRSISSFYLHQAAAIDALGAGRDVIVSTSTASGKSVIYQVPTLRCLVDDAASRAIFVYPTKALAQDQKAALQHLLHSCPGLEHHQASPVSTYDGDTPQEQRKQIREHASVIFTNFDTLHASILPHEELWRHQIFAIDELHYYTGLLGSHVAYILRRFRRICAAIGNRHVKFVSCSATISNPREHMERLTGLPPTNIEVVTEDGAPCGEREFVVWNPPPVDEDMPFAGRKSSIGEAALLMRYLMKRGVRVILFCKFRKVCEMAMKTLRSQLSEEGRYDILERVKSYRGGYSQEDRRAIERDAFSGHLLGIVATNALELGVDIGALDAVIMLGFPMSLASFRQQAGRAGRRSRDSLAVLVGYGDPLDQHYMEHPEELFDGKIDDLTIELESKVILEAHLQCAAHEMPISDQDDIYFGPHMREICERRLSKDDDGWYHAHPKFLPYPSQHVSIRGMQEEKYLVVDVTKSQAPKVLEELEISRALFEIYEGAVVNEISHDDRIARLVKADVNWITSPRDYTDVDAKQTYRIREIQGLYRAYYGRVEVMTKVFGFFKIRNNSILDTVDVDSEPWLRDSTGLWVDLSHRALELLEAKNISAAEAIHSAQHAFMNRFALAQDMQTECKAPEKEYMAKDNSRKRPARLIFYDAPGKGGGVTSKAFDNVQDTFQKACNAIQSCNCEDGCIKCIASPACSEKNAVHSKIGALIIIREILGHPNDIALIPDQPPTRAHNTIVVAQPVKAADGVTVEHA